MNLFYYEVLRNINEDTAKIMLLSEEMETWKKESFKSFYYVEIAAKCLEEGSRHQTESPQFFTRDVATHKGVIAALNIVDARKFLEDYFQG